MGIFDKAKKELDQNYNKLKYIKKGINFFGSARTNKEDKYYKMATESASQLAKAGFTIITGAGYGKMEAANKGAYEAGERSVGLNIDLPFEQEANEYITELVNFKYFYTRKVMFTMLSIATVVFPGGYGTLDEMFEQLTLIQNSKIRPRSFILVGTDYYKNLLKFIRDMKTNKSISQEDVDNITLADNVETIVSTIKNNYYPCKKPKYL